MEPEVERQVFFLNMHGFIWPAAGTDKGDSITTEDPGGIRIELFKDFVIPPNTTLYLHHDLGKCYWLVEEDLKDKNEEELYRHNCKITETNHRLFESGMIFPNIALSREDTRSFRSGIFKCNVPEQERIVIDYDEVFTGPKKNYMSEYIRKNPSDVSFYHNYIKLKNIKTIVEKDELNFDNVYFFYDTSLDSVIKGLKLVVGEDTHIHLHLFACNVYFDTPANNRYIRRFNLINKPVSQETVGRFYGLKRKKSKKYKSKKIRVKGKSKKYKSKKMRVKCKSKKDKSKKVRVKGKIKSK